MPKNTHYKHVVRKIGQLKPYPNNSRVHPQKQLEQVAASIKEFGFTEPLIIDENNMILAGHGRQTAAEMAGLIDVPCIIATGLTHDQKRAYVIADNQIPLEAKWDEEILAQELRLLSEANFDLDILAFDDIDLEDLLKDSLDLPDETEVGAYTRKIKAPNYDPSNEKPEVSLMTELSKYKELCLSIDNANIGTKEKTFLKLAATRHIVFNFDLIADYYAHSEKTTQNLMENSALVIIDFDKALENGFIQINKELQQIYSEDYPEGDL